jgi:hypothetical protein
MVALVIAKIVARRFLYFQILTDGKGLCCPSRNGRQETGIQDEQDEP